MIYLIDYQLFTLAHVKKCSYPYYLKFYCANLYSLFGYTKNRIFCKEGGIL